jgi:hypothetical protein
LAVGSPHDRQNEHQLKQQHGGKVVGEAGHGVNRDVLVVTGGLALVEACLEYADEVGVSVGRAKVL